MTGVMEMPQWDAKRMRMRKKGREKLQTVNQCGIDVFSFDSR
jgi:hypothetical protein